MIEDKFCLYPLSQDEQTTCESIISVEGSKITIMPTHHINEIGDFMGFRYETDPFVLGNTLPIVRTMFHGTTMVECNVPESKILELMSNPKDIQEKMQGFLQDLDKNCIPATLDCIPENAESLTKSGAINAMGLRTVDSKHWTPEAPERIGVYHAYIRGYNREVRTHKLFIICSGGLYKACDEFCNLIIDIGKHWTAKEVMESEETWWLRKACQRARCRLIKSLADLLGIDVTYMEDIQSYSKSYMAIPTSDTLEHDFGKMSNGKLCVYNSCMDTTKNMNGMLCNMHPSEGVWLFKGSHRVTTFGSMYGDHSVCGVFPINAPKTKKNGAITLQDASCVIRLNSKPIKESYMCFDEAYFKNLESMQWNRDNGLEALIPIVVGLK